MDLPLEPGLRFGTIGALGARDEREVIRRIEALGYDSLWVGDHIAFPLPILDPLLQLAQAAAFSKRLLLGTSVFLLPLRHPTLVAKQVATLDLLCDGRLVFGVGIGGEFPLEYAACNVPLRERGARMTESLSLLRRLWSGEPVESRGRFYPFPALQLLPPPRQPGGPPLWCGGRSEAALARIGRLGDGWIGYALTPERVRAGLEAIAKAAAAAGRRFERFGSGHLMFVRIDDAYETSLEHATAHLSRRYAMDFRSAAQRYAALGRPADVAARIADYQRAGLRHVILDLVGPFDDRDAQLERFAREVRPLLAGL